MITVFRARTKIKVNGGRRWGSDRDSFNNEGGGYFRTTNSVTVKKVKW